MQNALRRSECFLWGILMADASNTPQEMIDQILEFLRQLGVKEINITFEGCGDSGEFEIEEVLWCETYSDGSPVFPFNITKFPSPPFLPERSLFRSILDVFSTEINSGWENDEGGGGHLILRPFEVDTQDAVDVNVYHNESYPERDDDDEEDGDWEPEGAEAVLEQNAMRADAPMVDIPHADIRTEKKRPTFEEIVLPFPQAGR
jgi:hypothetical protein